MIILGENISQEQSFKKLKNKLYNYLNDLKNIIQYEFVFNVSRIYFMKYIF